MREPCSAGKCQFKGEAKDISAENHDGMTITVLGLILRWDEIDLGLHDECITGDCVGHVNDLFWFYDMRFGSYY